MKLKSRFTKVPIRYAVKYPLMPYTNVVNAQVMTRFNSTPITPVTKKCKNLCVMRNLRNNDTIEFMDGDLASRAILLIDTKKA